MDRTAETALYRPAAIRRVDRNDLRAVRERMRELAQSGHEYLLQMGSYDRIGVPEAARGREYGAWLTGENAPLTLYESMSRVNAQSGKGANQLQILGKGFSDQVAGAHASHSRIATLAGRVLRDQHLSQGAGIDQELLVSQMAELHQLSEYMRDQELNFAARELGGYLDRANRDVPKGFWGILWMAESDAGPIRTGLGLDEDPRITAERLEPELKRRRGLQLEGQEPFLDWRLYGSESQPRGVQPFGFEDMVRQGLSPRDAMALSVQAERGQSTDRDMARASLRSRMEQLPHLIADLAKNRFLSPITGRASHEKSPRSLKEAMETFSSIERTGEYRRSRTGVSVDGEIAPMLGEFRSRASVSSVHGEHSAQDSHRDSLARRAMARMEHQQEQSSPQEGMAQDDGLGY